MLRKRIDVQGRSIYRKKKERARIVTGESIGQVASQTTKNLLAIDEASNVPVYRSLIALDKQKSSKSRDALGRAVCQPQDSPLVTAPYRHPTTNAEQEELERFEAELLTGASQTRRLKALPGNAYSMIGHSAGC